MKFFVFSTFILIVVFTKLTWSAEVFVKTYFDHNRTFYVSGLQEGEWIKASNFQIFLFREAAQTCRLTPDRIKNEFSNHNKIIWKTLNRYFPNAQEQFLSLNLKISIDSFDSKNKNPDFGSFFIPQMPNADDNLIVLDCRHFYGKYWKALLGHEIIHALLSGKGVSNWAEELLAQNVEFELSREWPSLRVNAFAKQILVPSPITDERPFLSSARYSSNFLLGQYLLTRWGGLNSLRAFLPQVPIKECDSSSDETTVSDAAVFCRMQQLLINMKSSPELQDRSTLAGVLRHFAIALVLNKSDAYSQELYSIPGWKGFSSKPLNDEKNWDLNKINLERGSFLRLNPKLWFRYQNVWNPNLEFYRVLTYENGSYEILTADQIQMKNSKAVLQDTVILLNLSSTTPLPILIK